MYTRTYQSDEKPTVIPENYDGNAFIEEPAAEIQRSCEVSQETESEAAEVMKCVDKSDSFIQGILKKLPLQGTLSGLGIRSLSQFKIGTEEILIIGIALFLLFSKGGDIELAIMLLLLLFVK